MAAVPTESTASFSPVSAATLKKDESSADLARVQQAAPQARSVARYASTRAFSARLNWMNFTGVANPLKPGGSPNGNDVPPAARATLAESSNPTIKPNTESRFTNGARDAPTSWFTSTGAPSVSRVSMRSRKSSASIVFAKPPVGMTATEKAATGGFAKTIEAKPPVAAN